MSLRRTRHRSTRPRFARIATLTLTGIGLVAASGNAIEPDTARTPVSASTGKPPVGWPTTEGAPGGGRYSPLSDIHRNNVDRLEVVWTYRHGDVSDGYGPARKIHGTAAESTPLVVDGRLIYTTPYSRVIALDPDTGRELWTFDPEIDRRAAYANMLINRGAAYWRDRLASPKTCATRVFLGAIDARLIALDAATGRICPDFGEAGTIDLKKGIAPLVDVEEYNVTSPPTVVGDVVIIGSSIADTIRGIGPPGDVRAFDARTGRLLWTFKTIPDVGAFGAETWPTDRTRTGHANVWSTMTADLERGLVFLPVSTANPDFYGGDRQGANLFSDSVVALDAQTGERVWHFQTVHHDLWDYDLAAPPTLVEIEHEGRMIDAVAQATKTGFVFVLDRETGDPIFPVEERPVPASNVPGEAAWPTQPIPSAPPALVPQKMTEEDLWDRTPRHLAKCQKEFAGLRNEGIFTPPSIETSILYPFTGGGANWSGSSFDPVRRRLVVPVRNLAHTIRLHPLSEKNTQNGDGRVLSSLWDGLRWIVTGGGTGLRYWQDRRLFAVDGVPCSRPPFGLLVAVDLDSGTIAWRQPTGKLESGEPGLENAGPALVTAGGLVFHGGTGDKHLRAHDIETGEVLAEFELPAALHAGPITYRTATTNRQLLVVAPGGHIGLDTPQGDYVIAFGVPKDLPKGLPEDTPKEAPD